MTTLEVPHQPEVSGGVGDVVRRVVGNVAVVVSDVVHGPTVPDSLSEHFGHAEKRNDLQPNVDAWV